MNTVHRHTRRTLAAICLCCLLLSFACAQELPADCDYEFTGTEFGEEAAACGIFIEGVPEEECCALYLGSRLIRPGDFLPAQALEHLVLHPNQDEDANAVISYRPITDGTLGEHCEFTVHIASTRDDPPTAEDGKLQTYRNIANTGELHAADPEGETVSYHIETYPKRGTVELREDGNFVYTPKKNKVGEDSFTFTASDPAGNLSEVKTVQIEILKPSDAATFSDLDERTQFTGLWMRSNGLFGGETVADQLCFCPEKQVTRGEFLVMAMKLAGVQPEIGLLSSGFADQDSAPKWMQSYLVSAMRRGIVSGVPTEHGLCFQPERPITAAEAAAIVCRICNLEKTQSVSSEDTSLPVWAASSVQTAAASGILLPQADNAMTRMETAKLLYSLTDLISE